MVLLSCQEVSKAFGGRNLFESLSLTVERGDHIGLIGPNGSGKSTFLKILAGVEPQDSGELVRRRSLRVGYVPQLSSYNTATVLEQVCLRLAEFENVSEIDAETRAAIVLGKVGFDDFDQAASTLSGGWRKRLDIARELVLDPDILLLDEPTNHLDMDAIEWLQGFLPRECRTYVIITHDRYFLEKVTSRVMELNPCFPGGLFSVNGPYSMFVENREAFIAGQLERQKSLNSKVRREKDWLRQTPKARTTKSRSRIQEAHKLMGELDEVKSRNVVRRTTMDFVGTDRATRRLMQGRNLSKTLGDRELFADLDVTLSPGYRLGIVGPNGTGKTTLLKLIASEMKSDTGTLKLAEGLKVVYFDQHRAQLPLETPLRQALCPVGDEVEFQGRRIHVNGWATRFLFDPDRLDLPISYLSGGERARVCIARLMLQPADILLLDEPTNDLDIPTLEILEESLRDFPGAVVLITHDRFLLDQVATEVLGFGCELQPHYCADYHQWERHCKRFEEKKKEVKKEIAASSKGSMTSKPRLSYKEKRELEGMESAIEKAEALLAERQKVIANADIAADGRKLAAACQSIQEAQEALDGLYARWEELESLTS